MHEIESVIEKPIDSKLRHWRRISLAAAVSFTWAANDGTKQTSMGVTRDISGHGAFILAEAAPPLDTKVRVDIVLPNVSGARSLHIGSRGRVVRVELVGGVGGDGFAIHCGHKLLMSRCRTRELQPLLESA